MKKQFSSLDILVYEALKTVMTALVRHPCTVLALEFDVDDEKVHTDLVEIVADVAVAIRKDRAERYFHPKVSFLFKRLEGEWSICQDSLLLHQCPESEGFTFGITDAGAIVSSEGGRLEALRNVFK